MFSDGFAGHMKTAEFQCIEGDSVRCLLCPHGCLLRETETGFCRVRGVHDGELRALGYGNISSINLDPMKKKPLYHFHPGRMILSIGGWGCNFLCEFCQNWNISQQFLSEARVTTPESIISEAERNGSVGIAYTYNEPLIGYEFVMDCSELARSRGLANVLVTNGYINPDPASRILPLTDAINIDIKSMDDAFYRNRCHGHLKPVQNFAVQAVKAGCHVEITNLVIPGLNDTDELFRSLSEWISMELGPETPLHLSAYRPQYKMRIEETPVKILLHAREICRESLSYVYLGNVPARFR